MIEDIGGCFLTTSAATKPECPQGIIQWQHGTFTAPSNGSLVLSPFSVDGRQLLSNPCQFQNSVYTRYHQSELFRVSVAWSAVTNPTNKADCLPLLELRTPYRPLQQSPSPQPLCFRRSPPKSHVAGLQTTHHASDPDSKPYHRILNRRCQIHSLGQRKGQEISVRDRGGDSGSIEPERFDKEERANRCR